MVNHATAPMAKNSNNRLLPKITVNKIIKKQAAETEAFNKFAEDLMKAYDMAETGMVEAKIKHTKQKIDLIKTEMAAEMALAKAKHEWTADQSKEYTKQAQELGNLNGELILLGIELNKSKQEDIKKQKEAEEDKYKTFLKDQVNYAEAKRAKDTEANQKELDDHLKVIETKRKLALYEAKSPGEIAKINAEADKEIFESKKKYSDEQRKLAEDDQKFWDEQIAETEKTEKQAADLKIKQDKDEEKELDAEAERLFKIQENETKRELELKKKQKEDEKRLAKQTIDVINGYFDLQTNTLKAEEEKQLSNTHLSEDQKLKIKHDFAKKEAEVERKKAEMAKVTGTMKAIIDTAEGVSGVLADFPGPVGWVMAIIQGALGAAQIAEIIAQPLPQIPSFKKGVKGFEGGQAQVHGKEIVQLQTGEKFLTLGGVDEPINTFLPKGTNVIPNEIVREQILQMPKARNNDDVLMQNQLLAELVKETKKDKPAVNFDIDANGINAFYSTRNSRIKYINSRFRGRS